MNKLSTERRTAIVAALVEGNSIRSTCRMTGVAKGTVLKLLAELGDACRAYHDATVREVPASRVQVDEIWSFVGCKARNVKPERWGEAGDIWTWVGMDADTKLAIAYRVGDRGLGIATRFVRAGNEVSTLSAVLERLASRLSEVPLAASQRRAASRSSSFASAIQRCGRPCAAHQRSNSSWLTPCPSVYARARPRTQRSSSPTTASDSIPRTRRSDRRQRVVSCCQP